jgi:hypothetical protein
MLIGACSGGAVVFAPTPPPPDTSPARYTHPAGAFSVNVPRQWALHVQDTTTLASASFSPPGADAPLLTLAAMRLNDEANALDFAALLAVYQTQIRPDAASYKEVARAAMPDGGWRLDGLRARPGLPEEAVNTFIIRQADRLGVIEVSGIERLGAPALAILEGMVDSVVFAPDAPLEPAPFSTLTFVKTGDLALLHVLGWRTPEGVFYITGEIANYGARPVRVPLIEAGLFAADGTGTAGASDTGFGYGLPPGGFTPFSLRFGEGLADRATEYLLRLIAAETLPDGVLIGAESLTWTDSADYDALNRLVISGRVTYQGGRAVFSPRATVTVFDPAGQVIGAAWVEVAERIVPGASVDFTLTLPELGGEARHYLVAVQGLAQPEGGG